LEESFLAFNVKRESQCLFPLPLLASKDSDNKDMELIEYKGKLVMTCIDKESNFMELWIIKDHNRKQWSKRHSINIGVLTRKEPNVSPLAFYNADVVLIKEYFF
jgi:F-box interacting protein